MFYLSHYFMTVNEVQELFCCCCHFFYCLCFLNTSHRPVVSVPNAVNNTKSIELLSNISLRALKSDAFVSIDTHVLQLLIPYKIQIGLDYTDLQKYDVIKWNCENFAWMCSTHGSICYSIQSYKLITAFSEDLSRGKESIVMRGVTGASLFSAVNCIVC